MDTSTRNTLLLIGAIFTGGYFLLQQVAKIPKALSSVGAALGSGLYSLFHPDELGETTFYTVIFPDGQRHAVASRSVTGQGRFTREGVTYQLLVDKTITSGVNKYAVEI